MRERTSVALAVSCVAKVANLQEKKLCVLHADVQTHTLYM